jgi:hypothetical protein
MEALEPRAMMHHGSIDVVGSGTFGSIFRRHDFEINSVSPQGGDSFTGTVINTAAGNATTVVRLGGKITGPSASLPGLHDDLQVVVIGQLTKKVFTTTNGDTVTFAIDVEFPHGFLENFQYFVDPDGSGGFSAVVNGLVGTMVVNNAPIARIDSASVPEDGSVSFNVLGNDEDGDGPGDGDQDGDSLSVVNWTAPQRGSLTANGNGSFTYTPDADFNGSDSFSYSISEGHATASADVVINVTPINDAPTTVDDRRTVDEDKPRDLLVLDNDFDVDGPNEINPASVEIVTGPGFGTATPNQDGTIRYSPQQNFNGADRLTYRVRDRSGTLSLPAELTIVVNSVLDKPIISGFTDDVQEQIGNKVSGDLTNDALPSFFGTSEPQSVIEVRLDSHMGTLLGTATANDLQQWTIQTTTPLPDGERIVVAIAFDGSMTALSDPFSLVVDTFVAAPTIDAIDVDSAAMDRVTNDSTPTFRGSGDAAEEHGPLSIAVRREDTLAQIGAGIVQASGSWSAPLTGVPLADRTYVVSANATDGAGNVSAKSQLAIVIDTQGPQVANIRVLGRETSSLPVPILRTLTASLLLDVTDQRYLQEDNPVSILLRDRDTGATIGSRTPLFGRMGGLDQDGPHQTATQTDLEIPISFAGLGATGQREVEVVAQDRAGNPLGQALSFSVFLSNTGTATYDAPGTPVASTRFFLGSHVAAAAGPSATSIVVDRKIPDGYVFHIRERRYRVGGNPVQLGPNEYRVRLHNLGGGPTTLGQQVQAGEPIAWLRPWTPTFDKTTQTIWFTNEDGHRLGQFDPATAKVKLYDIADPAGQGTVALDPHGVTFDFNSHLTPRVWFVYRNEHTGNDVDFALPVDPPLPTDPPRAPRAEAEVARLAYLDLFTGELVAIEFTDERFGGLHLKGAHNIQIDDLGTVWITAEHSDAIVELNFDQPIGPDSSTAFLDRRSPQVIVHQLPEELGDRGADNFGFDVHGLSIVVDQRTAERYVYFSDAAATGRVGLLRPGRPFKPATDTTPAQPATLDAWFEWQVDEAFYGGEGRSLDGHSLFLAIDDSETPGIPEDDKVVFADSGRPNAPRGAVRVLDPVNVITHVRANPTLPLPLGTQSQVDTIRTTKLPGSIANQKFAGAIQALIDREGNISFADALGGIGRFHPDDPNLARPDVLKSLPVAVVSVAGTAPIDRPVTMTATPAILTPVIISDVLPLTAAVNSTDGSQSVGIDQYELAAANIRTPGGSNEPRQPGVFRATQNAGSIFYGALAQSDNLTTTVFAETVRRQVEAVESKAALPAGATLGRMAFSVRRDGSLILTGREDGSVLDVQLNLSQLVSGMTPGAIPPRFLLEGEPNVVIDEDGTVTLFAVDQSPAHSLVRYRFQPSERSTMKKADFANPARWSVTTFAPPADSATGTLLVGEPTTFLDGQGNAGALATTELGHLVLYRPHLGVGFDDLTLRAPQPVFSSVAVVPDGNDLFVYGTNMKGDLVQYVVDEVHAAGLRPVGAQVLNEARPDSQSPRDTQVFQDVYAVSDGQKNQVFAGDGNARLVHFEIDRASGAVQAENVTELARAAGRLFGYFPFQQDFGGRVYAEIAPLIANGELFVYGTNGQDLIEFRRPVGGVWQAANLSNDLYSTSGANRGGPGQPPIANETNGRFPANFVFGAPGAYRSPDGDRHILQINADGEIVEYYFDTAANPFPRFHTQNITLRLAPSASADHYRTAPGRTLLVPIEEGVLANDRDPSGLPLTFRVFQNPAHGTLRLGPNFSFEYVPSAGFVGQDQFTYEALNGINESKLVTVTITVEQLPVGTILDDGNAGYSNSGSWRARTSAAGIGGDFRESTKGSGQDVATWSLNGLPKNADREYEVFVHWVPQSTLATNAPFVIYDNKTVVGGKRINEQRAPFGDEAAGVIWQSLGKVKINSGTLKVTLGDNANGTVVADAVRIVPVTPSPAAPPAVTTALLLVGQQPVATWHNAAQPANVNNDGLVNSLDLLAVLNWLTAQGGPSPLPASGDPSKSGFVDVNNDGQCSSLDLLAVINAITAAQTSTGLEPDAEGESVAGIPRAAGPREGMSPDLIELLAIDSLTTRRKGSRAR